MSNPTPGGRTDDDDIFTLTMFAYGSLGLIASTACALALGYWHTAVRWLVLHDVLAHRREHPLIELPYSRGAGLDLPRTLLLVALAVGLLAWGIHSIRRHFARREDR